MEIHRIGSCRNCGACCYILHPDGKYRLCQHYDVTKDKHCRIYVDRPQDCRGFPRGPMDVERVRQWCGFSFVDEKGRTVDAYMDRRVRLAPVAGR